MAMLWGAFALAFAAIYAFAVAVLFYEGAIKPSYFVQDRWGIAGLVY